MKRPVFIHIISLYHSLADSLNWQKKMVVEEPKRKYEYFLEINRIIYTLNHKQETTTTV